MPFACRRTQEREPRNRRLVVSHDGNLNEIRSVQEASSFHDSILVANRGKSETAFLALHGNSIRSSAGLSSSSLFLPFPPKLFLSSVLARLYVCVLSFLLPVLTLLWSRAAFFHAKTFWEYNCRRAKQPIIHSPGAWWKTFFALVNSGVTNWMEETRRLLNEPHNLEKSLKDKPSRKLPLSAVFFEISIDSLWKFDHLCKTVFPAVHLIVWEVRGEI